MNAKPQFELLTDMYSSSYYPDFLVDKIKDELVSLMHFLENDTKDLEAIQEKLDQMTSAINDIQELFWEHGSEIETVARDSIAVSVRDVLQFFAIEIDLEEALRERDW
ncbi:DUF5713 family protein [Paenibacillus sp. FSL K6-1230]|uniref:DUF5713 family protein n=1 Tax=Paenibacillus sp. FSL K6-1230 TaxID=2921603 RepID=UPI00039D752B